MRLHFVNFVSNAGKASWHTLRFSKLRQNLRYALHQPYIWQLPRERFLATLCNRKIAEILTDFFWISLALKGSVGKII